MEQKRLNPSHQKDSKRRTPGSERGHSDSPAYSLAAHPVLRMQQQVGNRQVARQLAQGNESLSAPAAIQREGEEEQVSGGGEQQMDTVKNVKSLYDMGVNIADISGADTTMPGIYGDVGGIIFDVLQSSERGDNVQDALLNASGTAVGGKFAGAQYEGDPISGIVDTSINAINSGAQLAGAPQEVTDVTSVAADVTPSTFMQQVGSTGFRAYGDIAEGAYKGDMKPVDDLVHSMQEGDSGAPLQGMGMMADVIPDLASGKSMDETIIDAGDQGKNSVMGRLGGYLGDEAYQFFEKDLPEAGGYLMDDIGDLFSSEDESYAEGDAYDEYMKNGQVAAPQEGAYAEGDAYDAYMAEGQGSPNYGGYIPAKDYNAYMDNEDAYAEGDAYDEYVNGVQESAPQDEGYAEGVY